MQKGRERGSQREKEGREIKRGREGKGEGEKVQWR